MKLYSLQHKILSALVDPNLVITDASALRAVVYPPDSRGRVLVPDSDPSIDQVTRDMLRDGLLSRQVDGSYFFPTPLGLRELEEVQETAALLSVPLEKPTNSIWESPCYIPSGMKSNRAGSSDYLLVKSHGIST